MESIKNIRDLVGDELSKKESDLREELFNLRFQQKVGQLENPLKIRSIRRSIAQVKTITQERIEKEVSVKSVEG